MLRDQLKLSDKGYKLYDLALDKTRGKLQKYGNSVRTRFYYPGGGDKIEHVDLREVIDSLMQEFNLKFPWDENNKKSPYATLINNKAFEVFNMRLHRLSPESYLIVVQNGQGSIIFIIRDAESHPQSNLKIEWQDDKLDKAEVSEIDFHITKAMLDLD